jgi:hypothetical protein
VLRKVFDHDPLSYNRRVNKEYREMPQTWLTVVMSGTPGQVEPLIPSPENGLFSRQVFYFMQAIRNWSTQMDVKEENHGAKFLQWGFRWDKVMEQIRPVASEVVFYLNEEQQDAFDCRMAALFRHADLAHGGSGRSTVARIAINLLRLMSMVAWIRAIDEWLMEGDDSDETLSVSKRLLRCPGIEPARDVAAENIQDGVVSRFRLSINEEDFQAMLKLADVLYRHSLYIMAMLPQEDVYIRTLAPREMFLNELPLSFTRKEAVELGAEYNFNDKQVDRLIEQMMNREELIRTSYGHFRFNSEYDG